MLPNARKDQRGARHLILNTDPSAGALVFATLAIGCAGAHHIADRRAAGDCEHSQRHSHSTARHRGAGAGAGTGAPVPVPVPVPVPELCGCAVAHEINTFHPLIPT